MSHYARKKMAAAPNALVSSSAVPRTPTAAGMRTAEARLATPGELVRPAGSHLIVDLHGASGLDDLEGIERSLIRCVEEAGATLLHIYLHPFEPNGGVSGVAVLAESHLSIHTWPEYGYAAADIFMCGAAEPRRCVDVLRTAFAPTRVDVAELQRGSLA